jgi:subtilisin family serine protease
VSDAVHRQIQRAGHARVIVELNAPTVPEGRLPGAQAIVQQRVAIANVRARTLAKIPPSAHRVVHAFETVPFVALEIDAAGLAALENGSPDVVRVVEDAVLRSVDAQSTPLVQADQAWAAGFDGTGATVAVLDTGVDSTHPFLAGKVIEEACYSSTTAGTSQTVCPNGQDVQIGPGAGAPCQLSDCFHGTHVAGIATGNGTTGGVSFSGVAPGANLMAVQVFAAVTDPVTCGLTTPPCLAAFSSDIIAGLERVYAVAVPRNIAAVNMSLGSSDTYTAPCDDDPTKPIIDNLRAIGIATVIAAGNNGSTTGLSSPGCISSAVSVGSTSMTDDVSYFSNAAAFLSLFAPGESITSSVPGGSYAAFSGTSMATPHVTGAWAILKEAMPAGTVSALLTALQTTGLPVTDMRAVTPTVTVPRIRVFQALASLTTVTNPAPTLTAVAPTHARAGAAATLMLTGSGFDAFSVTTLNGANMPTTVVNTTTIQATIPASALTVPGPAVVGVSTPSPGGGSSSTLPFTIDPPPTLTISAASVTTGASETVTLTNGLGGANDWLGLAATGAPDTSYLQWTYVGSGVTTRTWTVTMPNTAGTYEFRLYPNNGYARAATSPTVTVTAPQNPAPSITSLSPTGSAAGGPALTLTVNGTGFVSTSVVQWNGSNRTTTFVSASRLQAAITAADLSTAGSAQVAVFSPSPGGGTSSPVAFTISPQPTLSISAANVSGGATETVTLTNGLGGANDWLALAAVGAPDTSYLQWTYVAAGLTTRTWTVTMPTTPGKYEFRLYLNNSYVRAATSPPVAVGAGTNPAPTISGLSPSSAPAGAQAFTLTVNGTGFVSSSVVQWNGGNRTTTFVNASQLQASIAAADVAVAGSAQVAVFSPSPGGGTSSPSTFTIAPPPALTISAATVAPGARETVTLTNGLGGTYDWLALASTSAGNTTYLQWIYVGAGVKNTTWTVTMPSTPGTYEFRLFLNNGYTRAATSPTVTVTQ